MIKFNLFLVFFLFCFDFIQSAVFTSAANGNFNLASTWTISSGTDPNGIPDLDDDVIINHAVNINNTSTCASLVINAGGSIIYTPGQSLVCRGNFSNSGTFVNSGVLYIDHWASTASISVSSTTTINNVLTLRLRPNGKTINITSGSSFSNLKNIVVDGTGGGTANNAGNLSVTAAGGGGLTINTSTNFVNQTNGSLIVTTGIKVNSGTFTASAVSNTVTYTSTLYSTIFTTTYHNLVISNGSTTTIASKTLTGNLVVNGDLNINSNVALNCNNFNITIGGNWIHSGTSSAGNLLNPGSVTFNGSNQTITRASGARSEVLGVVNINSSGTVSLGSNLQCSNLSLNGGTFDLSASNFTCNLTGNLVFGASGLLNARNGKFRLVGSVAQTISGTGTPTFFDLTTRNAAGVSVTASVAVSNLLTDSLGQLATSGTGQIRLAASTATSYGRIGPVVGSLSGSGWVVESFVSPGVAGWTWLSTPINGNTLADWDSDPRFYMSGVGGNDGNASSGNGIFRSVRFYNTATNTYTNVTTISHVLVNGRGYRVYMSDNMTALTSALVYNSIGTPNFSSVNAPSLVAGGVGNGWNLVGNPYACPIDFSTLAANNPNINSAGYLILQDNGSTTTNTGPISPNQGFMVNTTSGGSTLTFSEVCKNTTSLPNLIRLAQPENQIKVIVSNDFNGLGSETSIGFVNGATDSIDANTDLPYIANIFEEADNIWSEIASTGERMILNQFNADASERVVELKVKPGVYGKHTLSFSGLSSLNLYNCIGLEDPSNNSGVDLLNQSFYNFYVSDTSKVLIFRLHFQNQQECLKFNNLNQTDLLSENTKIFNNGNGVVIKFGFTDVTPVTISVFNAIGQQVIHTQSLMVSQDLIPLAVPEGNQIYFVTIRSGDKILTRKIVN